MEGGGPAGVVEGAEKFAAGFAGVVGSAVSFLSRIFWKSVAVCDRPVVFCTDAGAGLAAGWVGRDLLTLSPARSSSAFLLPVNSAVCEPSAAERAIFSYAEI